MNPGAELVSLYSTKHCICSGKCSLLKYIFSHCFKDELLLNLVFESKNVSAKLIDLMFSHIEPLQETPPW